MSQDMNSKAVSALIPGGLMLLVGFGMGLSGFSNSVLYNRSVDVFVWTMRIGGAGLVLAAVLFFTRISLAVAVDAVISGLAGGIMVVVALIWLANQDLVHGVLVLLFGGMFLQAAWAGLSALSVCLPTASPATREPTPPDRSPEPPAESAPAEPLPLTKPGPEQAPPVADQTQDPDDDEPEGFLADFGRSDDH